MGFELINNIEKKFHIKLDLRELLRDASVIGITEYIHSVLSGNRGAAKAVNLSNECRLDESIQLTGEYRKNAGTVPEDFPYRGPPDFWAPS